MTAEQVEQWKRERDIAYGTNDQNAIKQVEEHRVAMLMDCQQKTATRVKELITQTEQLKNNVQQLDAKIELQKQTLDQISRESIDGDSHLNVRFDKLEEIIKNNDLNQKLKAAEVKGGTKVANWIIYVIGGIASCGGGAILLKLLSWFSSHPV